MLPTSTDYIAVSVGADLFYVHNLFTYFNPLMPKGSPFDE